MRKDELREMVRNIVEELCAKGKAYRKKRMAAGEKSSAYLSGRAVKVCKGQIKGESALEKSKKGMAMYGKSMNEAPSNQVDVFGYTTRHFDVCPGAQSLYKKLSTEDKYKDKEKEIVQLAKDHDILFGLEKKVLNAEKADDADVKNAETIANKIMDSAKKLGLDREHNYVQGHVDKIKDVKDCKISDAEKDKESIFQKFDRVSSRSDTQSYGPRNPTPTYESLASIANELGYINEEIKIKDNTEFKIKLKHLLQKHAVNLKRGKADTEFKLTLKHLLDKHVSKGGEEKDD